jgi:hypothetical protein
VPRWIFALLAACLATSADCPRAAAWNPLGHKVVCEIAWQQLDPQTRTQIADTLKRHPRFAEDFAPELPAEDADRWIFWQAGFWPDIARDIPEDVRDRYNHPTWHYVNHPLFLGPERAVDFNLTTTPQEPRDNWNLYQSTQHSLDVIHSDAPPTEKAVAYCWLFHLVGDMHLPLHTVSLVSDHFPTGDKGGSILKVLNKKEDLHSLWDCLLGDEHDRNDVLAAYQKLKADPGLWNVDTSGDFKDWMLESRVLAESLTYSPEILAEVQQSQPHVPIPLSEDYLQRAGAAARARVVAAGLRLATLLEHR